MAKQFGVSGNRPLFGALQTGEHIGALDGSASRTIYDEMRRSDPQISAVLRAIKLPVIRAEYRVEPASDDNGDEEIAEFVQTNLLEGMSMSWRDTLRHILLHKDFGFSVMEKLYVRSPDGKIRLKKLDPRLPTSIERWVYKADSLDHIEQIGSDGQTYDLPINRCVVFTENREGDNWEGTSALRAVYGMWLIKNEMYKIAAIKHDRHGVGIPYAVEGEQATDPQREAIDEILKGLHANEIGHMRLPHGWEAGILTADNKGGTDTEGYIKLLNEQIAVALLAQFLQLGSTETGSRALGQSFIDFFLLAMQETADYIADTLNRFVVRELVDYNFDVDEYPTLVAGQIKEMDFQTVATLQTAGVLSTDGELENAVRRGLGLPERDLEKEPEKPVPKPTDEPQNDEPEPEDEEDAPDVAASEGFQLSEPNETEQLVNLAEVDAQLDLVNAEVATEVLAIRDAQAERIIDQIIAGKAVRNISVPAKKDMYDVVVRAYKQQTKVGRQQVREELQRQGLTKLADPISDSEFTNLLLEELSLLVEGASDKLKTMIAQIALDLQKTGYSGTTLLAQLELLVRERISDATWEQLVAAAVNEGWGQGRRLELVAQDNEIDHYYRSSILDKNRCSVCRSKHHKVVTPSDPDFQCPDQECEGGPARCRCLIIGVLRREAVA